MTQEQNDSVRVSPSHISTMNNFNSVFIILPVRESRTT